MELSVIILIFSKSGIFDFYIKCKEIKFSSLLPIKPSRISVVKSPDLGFRVEDPFPLGIKSWKIILLGKKVGQGETYFDQGKAK